MGLEQIMGKTQEEYISSIDRIIDDAFLEHFGFPLLAVQDRENLEHIVVCGDPIESFRYRGETFLYWNRSVDSEYESKQDGVEVTFTTQFKKV